MEVTITQFRRNLFSLVDQAMDGNEIWVKHKGNRFKLTPEKKPLGRLARIQPCDYINDDVRDDRSLLREMTEAWEKDWADL